MMVLLPPMGMVAGLNFPTLLLMYLGYSLESVIVSCLICTFGAGFGMMMRTLDKFYDLELYGKTLTQKREIEHRKLHLGSFKIDFEMLSVLAFCLAVILGSIAVITLHG